MGGQAARDKAAEIWAAYQGLYGTLLATDFYPLHFYLPKGFSLSTEIANFESHVGWFEARRGTLWNGPQNYWLTEYGMPAWSQEISEAELLSCMQGFTAYLMSNTVGVTSWSWWPDSEAALLDESKEVTALGNLYYELATEQ